MLSVDPDTSASEAKPPPPASKTASSADKHCPAIAAAMVMRGDLRAGLLPGIGQALPWPARMPRLAEEARLEAVLQPGELPSTRGGTCAPKERPPFWRQPRFSRSPVRGSPAAPRAPGGVWRPSCDGTRWSKPLIGNASSAAPAADTTRAAGLKATPAPLPVRLSGTPTASTTAARASQARARSSAASKSTRKRSTSKRSSRFSPSSACSGDADLGGGNSDSGAAAATIREACRCTTAS
mmetsp:Transcript_49859/g.108854  ORF Transcript_49859/g.108854 Transcript_49859/m.108854 type:complete len:239 (-) Transcript_49859:881-1597(-)